MKEVNLQGTVLLALQSHRNERVNTTLRFAIKQDGVTVPIDLDDATAIEYVVRLTNSSGQVLKECSLGDGVTVDGNALTLDYTSNYKNQSGACWFTITVTKPNWGRRTVVEGPFTIL